MSTISTNELELKIKSSYSNLRKFAEGEKIYKDLEVLFSSSPPINFEGVYAYSQYEYYYYVAIERGVINMKRATEDLTEISYWIFSDATFKMAVEYEYRNRVKNIDPRRIYFKKQLELLRLIGLNYKKMGEIEINKILKNSPYDDSVFENLF